MVASYRITDSVPECFALKPFFVFFVTKVLLNCRGVTRIYVPVVFQSEGSENNSRKYIIRPFHKANAMKKSRPSIKFFQLRGSLV